MNDYSTKTDSLYYQLSPVIGQWDYYREKKELLAALYDLIEQENWTYTQVSNKTIILVAPEGEITSFIDLTTEGDIKSVILQYHLEQLPSIYEEYMMQLADQFNLELVPYP